MQFSSNNLNSLYFLDNPFIRVEKGCRKGLRRPHSSTCASKIAVVKVKGYVANQYNVAKPIRYGPM